MYISTHLNDDQAEKLAYIQQQTNQEVSEIIEQALELYYEKIYSLEQLSSNSGKSLLEVFQELGLVGCLKDGDPELSSNYKAIVSQEMEEKYEREQQYQHERKT